MADVMFIKDGKKLSKREKKLTKKELDEIAKEKEELFNIKKDKKDKVKKSMGGAMQKTYGVKDGGFTKRGPCK
tara:strand:+ start:275 stop:493 length:219 start_codon:yes stop_codon:yes gene_type:complete